MPGPFSDFANDWAVGPYGPSAAAGNPSGYDVARTMTNRSEIVMGLIVAGALLLLITGVVGLRASGEVVI